VDLSSPFPASDELPIDQLNIGGVDITAEGGSIARLLEFNNIQDQKLHATDFDIQTASSSHLGLVDSSRCEWMAGPDESFAALDQLRRSTSRSTTPSPAWAWIIRPEELDLEDGAHLGGRIAQGKWRNSLVIVKVLSKQAEASVRQSLLALPSIFINHASCPGPS
jgi:hypothetical protein